MVEQRLRRHRRAVDRRRAAVVPALVAAAVMVVVIAGAALAGRATAPATSQTMTVATTTATATATATVTAVPPAVTMARAMKPLSLLAPGDRVLYEGEVAYFREWNGSIASAGISARPRSPVFDVLTGFLTPVEPAP